MDTIYAYTIQDALEDGQIGKVNEEVYATDGVLALRGSEDYTKFTDDLSVATINNWMLQPDRTVDGGNNKDFFSFVFRGTKLFAAKNELNKLTVMLPEEY